MRRFHLPNNHYFTRNELIGAVVVAVLFTAALFISKQYGETIENIVLLNGSLGMLFYVVLGFLGVVLAPAAALPFLPIAVNLWGSTTAALLTLAGWGSGSIVAFVLARRFGRPFVGKFISIKHAENISRRFTGKYTFWLVLVSRLVLPTDIVSYAIGLFVPIRFIPYSIATLLGMIPLVFALTYGVALPLQLQATAIAIIFAVFAIFVTNVIIRSRLGRGTHTSEQKIKRGE